MDAGSGYHPKRRPHWGLIVLSSAQNRPFLSFIRDANGPLPTNWIDAEVEIDGLNWTETDLASRPVRFRLFCHSTNQVRVIVPGNDNPFIRPSASWAELNRRTNGSDARIRVKGVVTAVDTALNLICLRGEDGPIKLQALPSLSGRYLIHINPGIDPTFREVLPPAPRQPKPGEFPPEDHPRLFEAFHRASNVDHVSGTGLGLMIVRRCVDLHRGRIAFTSRLNEGTTFTVHVPAFGPTVN